MTKNKKQKKLSWIKMPINVIDDERVAELVASRGVTGLGIYLAILCEMYRRNSRCLTLTQVRALKFAGATQKSVMAVVENFNLFYRDNHSHIFSMIDYLNFDDDDECDLNQIQIGFESPSFPTPARVNIKDKDKDIDLHYDAVDFINAIPENSQWTDVTLMKSGFGELIRRNWQETLKQFCDHVIANCSNNNICSVEDAKKYFYFFVTHQISGNRLRQSLEEYEQSHCRQNPYCFEDAGSTAGKRSYHGIELPDDAPPRPDERSEWDIENGCWI